MVISKVIANEFYRYVITGNYPLKGGVTEPDKKEEIQQ